MNPRAGHSVIAVPVPDLDDVVRDRTIRYDSSYLSTDPAFVHAHITLLGPWLDAPTEEDLQTVAGVLATEPTFAFVLAEVREFADGIVHLVPEPRDPFARLTARLAESFPQTPPYSGRYLELVPHLTLEHRITGATAAGLRAELGSLLPLRAQADRVDLQWWANDDCHVRHTWRLGR
ncbi:2'-5' RNA ligase family protein [Nocardioides sp.]|uniref:2'-5' RNA ligase family protein n=1 Tax=Nocardioides sp. TaxID=35761 RepID=UPI002BF56329|nr:2'-5' RNA ligase family protein [Nocardioides sp.]HXH79442.1 2'-5' RNA ligase family protein [Nocardioides sp.]